MFENLPVRPQCAEAISAAVRRGTLSHAVILEGADEVTRAAAAKELAKALLCEGTEKPCGVCRRCKKVDSGNHPDLYILKKEDSDSFIKVEAVRTLKEKTRLLPNDGARSVFILQEAEDMNPQAQNALLKVLEEPAAHVSFILTCPSRMALLETIRSRATTYTLSDAESQCGAEVPDEATVAAADAFLLALCSGNELDLLLQTAAFQKDKVLFQQTLPLLPVYFRDAMTHASGVPDMCASPSVAARLAAAFPLQKLLRFSDEAQRMLDGIQRSANHNLSVNALCSAFYAIKTE